MKSRIVAATLTIAVSVTGLALVEATPAFARGGCASKSDYKKVKNHQTVPRVQHELHSKGHVDATSSNGGYRDVIRSFKTCDQYAVIEIGFSKTPGTKLTVDSKSGIFE